MLERANHTEVEVAIHELKLRKAVGYDSIPIWFLNIISLLIMTRHVATIKSVMAARLGNRDLDNYDVIQYDH